MAILIPALLAGGLTTWQLGGAYQRLVETSLRGGARTLAVAVDREVEVAVTAVSSLATSNDIRAFARGEPSLIESGGPVADLYERARAVANAFGGWFVLVRPDGQQLFNTQRPLGTPLPLASGMPWIAQAVVTGKPAITDLFIGSVAQRPVLAAIAPVFPPGPRSGDGPAPLALILAFDTARIAALLARVREGEIAGLIQIEDSTIIARSVGHAAASGRRAPEWVATPLRRHETGLTAGPSLEGAPLVAAFQRLDRVPWAVVVTAPEDSYAAASRRPLERLAIGGAALLAAGLVLAALLARRLLRPVQALVSEAEAVAAGAPPPNAMEPPPVAEFEALRQALSRAAEATRPGRLRRPCRRSRRSGSRAARRARPRPALL
ncbi:cache domain-containing protein [Dankookia sp. P2]|uniref:cache domain-containing protein n=1 Tax=Dankookia sp. P2 TaxID=3423955 RepID=UPI003D677E9F